MPKISSSLPRQMVLPLFERRAKSRAGRPERMLIRGALVTSAAALCALSTPAAAQKVSTYAQNGDEGSSVVSTYNYNTDDNFSFYRAPVGAKRFGGCAPGAQQCVATQTGTIGSSPNANASFSGTSLSDVDYGAPGSGSSYARADLTTGQLGVSVDGSYRSIFGDPGHGIGDTPRPLSAMA